MAYSDNGLETSVLAQLIHTVSVIIIPQPGAEASGCLPMIPGGIALGNYDWSKVQSPNCVLSLSRPSMGAARPFMGAGLCHRTITVINRGAAHPRLIRIIVLELPSCGGFDKKPIIIILQFMSPFL